MKPVSALLAVCIILLPQEVTAQDKSVSCEFQVAVTVSNSKTHEVLGDLSPDAFVAKSGSSDVHARDAQLVNVGHVFIFLDVSRSVTGSSNSSDQLVETTNEVLSMIPEGTPITAVPFAERSMTIRQRNLVVPYLQKLSSSSDAPLGKETRLYDVLVEVAETERISLNDSVIVISDLEDNSSRTGRISAENRFKRIGSRPAFILLANPLAGTFEAKNVIDDVRYFANNTAGFYLSRRSPYGTGILPAFFYGQALRYYRLTFPPGSITDTRVKLSVLDSSGKKMQHVEIRATEAFPECQY